MCPEYEQCAIACDGIAECLTGDFDEREEAGCDIKLCGENLTATDQPQKFTSPNYPSEYLNSLNCVWLIKSEDPDKVIEINFENLDLEGTFNRKCYDYLEFFDGNSTQSDTIKVKNNREVCGRELPDPASYFSTGSKLTVRFTSDTTSTTKGFVLSYQSVPRKTKRHVDNQNKDKKFIQKADEDSDTNNQIELTDKKRILKDGNSKTFKNQKRAKNSKKRQKRSDNLNRVSDGTEDSKDSTENDYDSDYTNDYDYSGYDYSFETDHYYKYTYTDYFNLYKASTLPDYSDFRRAAFFHQRVVRPNGHQGLLKLQAQQFISKI
ncbi:bone morphogenetic protein 1-like [Symsagittifera roscoffensis]|uniref:bone morphogenetic protein 1-like n=1 Tax=Symsagittifera roscoffensis TaxID=84072 RepID=UPI00307B5645